MTILHTLETFLAGVAELRPGSTLSVAFSGGPDSVALLWGLKQTAPKLGLELFAAHLDHGLDKDSCRRARAASKTCETLGVPLWVERREVARGRVPGESLEAAARRIRYGFLEEVRQRGGAAFTVTGHHADDQIETLLLRIAFGSGIMGLTGIAAQRDRILRPLLSHSRQDLLQASRAAGLVPIIDPTNFDLRRPRNRTRHLLLPHLMSSDPELAHRMRALSATAARFQDKMDRALERRLALRVGRSGVSLQRETLENLPPEVLPFALGLMHRAAGLPYPPSRRARSDLSRQLEAGTRIGCDCGGGWRWESESDRVRLCRKEPQQAPFAYTLKVPGECAIPEAGLRLRIEQGRPARWMFASSPRRTGLSLPIVAGDEVTIRNRRPGDRLRPLGCAYTRRLKEVLVDRRVPRRERDRLPLLFAGSRLAWVPGVTVNEDFKVRDNQSVWVVQIEPL